MTDALGAMPSLPQPPLDCLDPTRVELRACEAVSTSTMAHMAMNGGVEPLQAAGLALKHSGGSRKPNEYLRSGH